MSPVSGRVVVCLLVACAALTACGGVPDPAETARVRLEALARFDLGKVKDLTCSEEQAQIDDALALFGSSVLDLGTINERLTVDVSGLKYEQTGASDVEAVVAVSGVVKISFQGQSAEETIAGEFPLVKENGVWKVCTSRRLGQ
jgi:hypothetical protein